MILLYNVGQDEEKLQPFPGDGISDMDLLELTLLQERVFFQTILQESD